ncbi:hypothetical protein [uncultured Algibacter sp.]|uniref:hypothetical protein n=1 Tax=uncultured Algibacter sp. TaxID=298659 RepID=UPI002638E468|nr:hypothetical protein [uncultured Algibacter sp.]
MKIKLKYLISSPFIAISALIFLWYIPYLYPSYFFPFEKVYGFWGHTLFCLVLLSIVIFSRILSGHPSLKLERFEAKDIVVPKVTKTWFTISKVFIYTATLMNILIATNAYLTYDGNIHASKASLADFGGINILSQFYLFFIVPYLLYTFQNKLKWNKVFVVLLGLILLTRSIYLAERLAILEFVLPIILVLVTLKNKRVLVTKFLKYFAFLLLFFVLLELSRQFSDQYGDKNMDVWFKLQWTLERFFNYYGDTQNKFYYVFENGLSFETTNYLEWAGRVIRRITGIEIETGHNIDFGKYHWRDYTNFGGLSYTYTDFGIVLGVTFLITFFTLFFRIWFKLKTGSLYAWSVYPMFFLWVAEFPRYNGIFLNRFIIAFILFNFTYLIFRNVKIFK